MNVCTLCLLLTLVFGHEATTPVTEPSQELFTSPIDDAVILWDALHSKTIRTTTTINILAKRSLEERLAVAQYYHLIYGGDLPADLKNNLTGGLKTLIADLMTPLPQFYASKLHAAVAGVGTDEAALTEILSVLDNDLMRATRQAYHEMYGETLEDAIIDDTDDLFQTFLLSLSAGERNETAPVDENEASAAADSFVENEANPFEAFYDAFTYWNFEQLRVIFQYYEVSTEGEVNIEKVFRWYLSGDIVSGFVIFSRIVDNGAAYFAEKLHERLESWTAVRRGDLVRIVVMRREVDMDEIKREYEARYLITLGEAIKAKTFGYFRECLLVLIGES